MSKLKKYVVYYCERMRDGMEEGAKIVGSLDEAVALAEKIVQGYSGDNTEVRVFELGKEVPLNREVIEEKTEVVKSTTKIKLK